MKKIKKYIEKNYKRIILLLMSIIFIVFAIRVKKNPGLKIDDDIYNFIHGFTSDNLTNYFKLISNMISGPIIGLMVIVSVIVSYAKKNYKYIPFIIGNIIIILGLNLILKNIYSRPRPEFMLIDEYGYSFPSGHAMVSMAFYGLFIYILFHVKMNKHLRYILSGLIFVLIAMIGLSRIYLHVHYFSDVIAGFAVSVIYLIFFTKFMKIITGNGLKKESMFKSFYYAFRGIATGFKQERNMQVHIFIMASVIIFGILLKISLIEWMICIILFGLVISLEYVNTAIESAVDVATTKYSKKAEIAKDTAASAVLVVSIVSVIVGLMIFIPKIFF